MDEQNKKYFAYIRVSSEKQAESASTSAQKAIIKDYAKSKELEIVRFFEEVKSAGEGSIRVEFRRMVQELKTGKANGLIFHKLDRSCRNMKEWTMLEDLYKKDIDVRFISGEFDFRTPTGKLSARIQASMSAFYLDNLSEEVKKGLYQRLEDGIYPFGAPPGYINKGPGKLKKIDPVQGSLVKKVFELYATDSKKWNERSLAEHMNKLGLKSMRGNKINKGNISSILNNPFYAGIIRVKGKSFEGKHRTLIDMSLFRKVQKILKDRYHKKQSKHYYIFRELLKCFHCGRTLRCVYAKKKYHYYYCIDCKTRCIGEEVLEKMLLDQFKKITFSDKETELFKEELQRIRKDVFSENKTQAKSLNGQIGILKGRLNKLLDMRLDDEVETEEYDIKKTDLLIEIKKLEEKRLAYSKTDSKIIERLELLGKLLKSPLLSYKKASLENRRRFVQIFTENLFLEYQTTRNLIVEWKSPFDIIAKRQDVLLCGDDGI